jgi:hypothetical protein
MMTSVEGIFSSGNVLHVHDLVDFVSEESKRTGGYTADYLTRKRPKRQVQIRAGANIKYVNPARFNPDAPDKLYMRSLVVKNNAKVQISVDNVPVRTIKKNHVQPSEMISVKLREKDLEQVRFTANSVMEVSVQ